MEKIDSNNIKTNPCQIKKNTTEPIFQKYSTNISQIKVNE